MLSNALINKKTFRHSCLHLAYLSLECDEYKVRDKKKSTTKRMVHLTDYISHALDMQKLMAYDFGNNILQEILINRALSVQADANQKIYKCTTINIHYFISKLKKLRTLKRNYSKEKSFRSMGVQ